MKVSSLGVLRQMIREVLVTEKAKGIVSKGVGKLALTIIKGASSWKAPRTYLLYDPTELAKQLKGGDTSNAVYGVVVVNMKSAHQNWGAKDVSLAAAQSGYGPMMYDIVMADVGGLVADRESVSAAARGVWDFYKNNRPDVEKKQIDDWQNPVTPTRKDDGVRWNDKEPGDALDYAYFLDQGPDTSALKANHKAALPMLKKVSREEGVPLDFEAIALQYFKQKYGQS